MCSPSLLQPILHIHLFIRILIHLKRIPPPLPLLSHLLLALLLLLLLSLLNLNLNLRESIYQSLKLRILPQHLMCIWLIKQYCLGYRLQDLFKLIFKLLVLFYQQKIMFVFVLAKIGNCRESDEKN